MIAQVHKVSIFAGQGEVMKQNQESIAKHFAFLYEMMKKQQNKRTVEVDGLFYEVDE